MVISNAVIVLVVWLTVIPLLIWETRNDGYKPLKRYIFIVIWPISAVGIFLHIAWQLLKYKGWK